MLIKTNFHLHTSDDPRDKISYSIFDAIDKAKEKNYGCLALTCHRKFVYKKEYEDYAKKKDILLIPGIEASIEKKDILILNPPYSRAGCKEVEQIKNFEDLAKYKKENPEIFIIAPHPFVPYVPRVSLSKKLIKNIESFDAIEKTIFSNKIFNFNKKAGVIAEKYNKPFIATSDVHQLKDVDRGYVLIEAKEKTPQAIFEAIRKGDFKNKLNSMGIFRMAEIQIKSILRLL